MSLTYRPSCGIMADRRGRRTPVLPAYHQTMKHAWIAVLAILLGCAAAIAQPKPAIDARLNYDALQPGQQAVIAVIVDIPAGLHSQSHTPTSEDYVAFVITPDPASGVNYLAPQYPPAHDVNYAALGKLSVYDGRVVTYVPFTLAADAPPGPLRITGRVQIQMCDEQACFRPYLGKSALPFEISTQIVPNSQAIVPANNDLFTNFNPRVFAAGSSTQVQLFGWSFELGQHAYLLAFGAALIVGVIFNLMPCVLPVVPLKAIGFYEASQHSRARCFGLGVVFSAGLLAVFALLSVLVIIGGATWGELFARGWFVWSIVTVLVIMAAGQLGAFSVVLPTTVYSYVPTHSSLSGNFLFGGFTAILSTPCTAPMFVGLLLWAAGQPKWVGVATVLTVGLGMALPYLILAAFPDLARKLPRTGAWSELLKQFMAFLLLAVAAYFAAGRLISGNGYLWIVFAVVLVGCIFLVARTRMLSPSPRALATSSCIALILAGGLLWFTVRLTRELIAWEPYTAQAFERAIGEKRAVMLEFTANWCANCKELESRVFSSAEAADTIRKLGVVPMRADLSKEDAPGFAKLTEINKAGGIPLTVIYSPTLERPIELSSIYTTQNLMDALVAATGSKPSTR